MLCYINLSYSILSCTYTKATILEQNILLQDLANVGVTCVRLCGMFEFFCGGLWSLDIDKITVCTRDRTANINNVCSFFFTS